MVNPCKVIDFFGMIIDTSLFEFRLPFSKIVRLKNMIYVFLRKNKVLKKGIEKKLGLLAFTSHVMPIGCIFSRRLYLATAGLKLPFSHIRLTASLKEDLLVWARFLEEYNGHSLFKKGLYLQLIFIFLHTLLVQ